MPVPLPFASQLRRRLPVLLLFLALISPRGADALTVDDYEVTRVEGWTVRVEKSLAGDPRRAPALSLLQKKLRLIVRAVPSSAVPKLRRVTIWLSMNNARGAAYHPSPEWLVENGRFAEMAGGIELANVDDFLEWSKIQPWMVLHEFAHAWHHRFVAGGYDNPVILSAYKKAKKRGRYNRVRYYDGTRKRAYALNDQMEFFAEISEAYFGKNDFQPFDNKELKAFDRTAYAMVEKIWKVRKRR